MQVVDSRVRKCKDVSIIINKKMRQRKIEYDRYMIPLNDSHPFELDEFVKILRKSDFEKPSNTSCLGVKNFQFLTDRKYDEVLKDRENN